MNFTPGKIFFGWSLQGGWDGLNIWNACVIQNACKAFMGNPEEERPLGRL